MIHYSKAYDEDQVGIVNQIENDYRKAGDAGASQDTEALLRIIQDNPELVAKLLSSVK